MFTLLICSDVCGQKINLEVPFSHVPTLQDIKHRADAVFYAEVKHLEAQGALDGNAADLLRQTAPPTTLPDGEYRDSGLLSLSRVQVYDDNAMKWTDLVSSQQLHEFDQLYMFPRHRAHLGNQRDLPAPRPPAARGPSPPRPLPASEGPYRPQPVAMVTQRPWHDERAPPRREEIAPRRDEPRRPQPSGDAGRSVFEFADRSRNNYISFEDFASMFKRLAVNFSENVVDEMFRLHSQNGNFITHGDFDLFLDNYPTLASALSTRIVDRRRDSELEHELNAAEQRMASNRRREEEILRELDEIRRSNEADKSTTHRLRSELDDLSSRRRATEEDEQALLDKEARVRYHRIQLQREERDLAEATRQFESRHGPITPIRAGGAAQQRRAAAVY